MDIYQQEKKKNFSVIHISGVIDKPEVYYEGRM